MFAILCKRYVYFFSCIHKYMQFNFSPFHYYYMNNAIKITMAVSCVA